MNKLTQFIELVSPINLLFTNSIVQLEIDTRVFDFLLYRAYAPLYNFQLLVIYL